MKTPQTNKEIRQWYLDELSKIPKLNEQWTADNVSLEQRAKLACEFRREKRLEARAKMEKRVEVKLLRLRDLAKYGTPDGPTFELLVKRFKAKGLTGNDVFEAIIKSSDRSDADFDKSLGF